MSDVKDTVRTHYAEAAKRADAGQYANSSNAQHCSCGGGKDVKVEFYDLAETSGLPDKAVLASLGCGNPTALAELKAGETVLDLGSGGGIDVLLSARRVGPTGKAYGLDMTDEMLKLANENKEKSGLTNVEFLKGEIEAIPLPDNSVDVIISNCVINLSGDKDKVFREAFRVLKPGGRFAVSDTVARGAIADELRKDMELWASCLAGSLADVEYEAKLKAAGFTNIGIEPTHTYTADDAKEWFKDLGMTPSQLALAAHADGKVISAFIRATKPAGGCCGGH
ncbi:arsenite methyltransferase [Rhizomicrobium electricum]|uniref:Arsenite methyltransferase n=1 Tax=Rhizomicrobium electricum TaxID=480070 RepID=A0ABN1EWB7_9PROT|nr:arsenite methyltransferase [Rhizomicrobium electricum]NIJ50062.1 SAM-dependent methyltransferase [Rhizomicrobium electricum]